MGLVASSPHPVMTPREGGQEECPPCQHSDGGLLASKTEKDASVV